MEEEQDFVADYDETMPAEDSGEESRFRVILWWWAFRAMTRRIRLMLGALRVATIKWWMIRHWLGQVGRWKLAVRWMMGSERWCWQRVRLLLGSWANNPVSSKDWILVLLNPRGPVSVRNAAYAPTTWNGMWCQVISPPVSGRLSLSWFVGFAAKLRHKLLSGNIPVNFISGGTSKNLWQVWTRFLPLSILSWIWRRKRSWFNLFGRTE